MGRKDEIEHGAVTAPTYIDKRNRAKKFAIETHDLIQQADFFRLVQKMPSNGRMLQHHTDQTLEAKWKFKSLCLL